MESKIYIGIDPGWKNLGLAILEHFDDKTLKKKNSYTLDPSSFSSITKFIDFMDSTITPLTPSVSGVTIERFVAYNTIHTAESEKINMLIGALCFYFGCKHLWNVEASLVRAIEWKTALVKGLFKLKNFQNPSEALDKKFSIAAANCCLDNTSEFKNDHEADAICLAALPIFISKGT